VLPRTVRLTSIYYQVPGNREFCVAPSKTIVDLVNLEEPIGYPAQPRLIRPSVRPSVGPSICICLQIRYSAENDTSPTDLVNYSLKSWIVNQKFFRKKSISKSNTVNNMKLMILKKIRVIHTCSSSPCAASVNIEKISQNPSIACHFRHAVTQFFHVHGFLFLSRSTHTKKLSPFSRCCIYTLNYYFCFTSLWGY